MEGREGEEVGSVVEERGGGRGCSGRKGRREGGVVEERGGGRESVVEGRKEGEGWT